MQRLVLSIIFLFLLMGCNQEVMVLPAETATAVSPTSTSIPPTDIPTNTPTSTAAATPPVPTPTAIPPTHTPTPAFLLPADAADVFVQNIALSSLGQLVYIRDGILYMESAPQTSLFEQISEHVSVAAWSPDGSELLYSTTVISNTDTDDPIEIYEQRLWSVTEKDDVSLSELISNYPNPAYAVNEVYWTPNGAKILLQSSLSDAEFEEIGHNFQNKLSVVDFESKTYTENQLIESNQWIIWLTDDVYVLRFHCGSPCADISAYDYTGALAWSPYWDTGGFVAFVPNGNFMINVGRIDTKLTDSIPTEPYLPTLDKIILSTGAVDVLWELPVRDDYFTPFIMPSISPDEQHFSFSFGSWSYPSVLYIVDEDGNEHGQYENSYMLDWRENGDFMVNTLLESGENQLRLISLDGLVQEIFNTNPDVEIMDDSYILGEGGGWSPDGKHFAFITKNKIDDTAQIYIWNSDIGDPQLIHSVNNDKSFRNMAWLPDSNGIYFTSGKGSMWREAIWFYNVVLNELKLVAPTN